jgi:hypothetical protein
MSTRVRTATGVFVVSIALLGATAVAVAATNNGRSSQQYSHSQLVGRAVLESGTFRPDSAASGAFFSAADRTTAINNGVAVETNVAAPALGNQAIQGFSALIPAGEGEWWALTDNGFGARANSADSELWINKVKPSFAPAGDGSVTITGGFGLSDPKSYVPWKIVCDSTKGTDLPNFDFNKLPIEKPALCGAGSDRKLTGFDFDPESLQIAADGTIWIGEEFGPFLLQVNTKGELLQPPVPLAGVKSPQNPTIDLASSEQPTLASSRGFEGMGISPDRTKLYPITEGARTGDDQNDLRVSEFSIPRNRYTGRYWKVRLELRSAAVNATTLKKSDGTPAYPGAVAPPAGFNAIGEFTMINNNQAIMIERDNGGDAPNPPRFKKLFVVDLGRTSNGYASKTLLADLMALPDPNSLGNDGPYFRFPFTTIESVYPVNDHTLALVNDNNFPFSNGRSFSKGGPLAADDNEFILVSFDQRWRQDPRLAADGQRGSAQLEDDSSTSDIDPSGDASIDPLIAR